MAPRSSDRHHGRRSRGWIPATLTVVVLAGGYLAADIYDVAPGVLTNSSRWPDPEPFPTANLPEGGLDVSLGIDETAPVPQAAAIGDLVADFLGDPFVGPDPGVLVTDALTGEVLAASNGDEPQVPASTTKLLTAVAALDAVGPDHEIVTRVVDGAKDDPAAVTLMGGGDLTLAAGAGDPHAVIGRGGIASLAADAAAQLRADGRTAVTDVVVDEGRWEGPRLAPRWEEQDLIEGWIIPMAPVALDLGRVDGQLTRSSEPAKDAGKALRKELEGLGIEVTGSVRLGSGPDNAPELAKVESAPLAELVEYMLVHSDNVLAESLGRLVAEHSGRPASFDGAEEAIIARLTDLGVPTAGLRLADTSGLSSVNQISPRTLVAAMDVISTGHPDLLATIRGLPVAGLEGTLRHRMGGTAAAGLVTAKTGSLNSTATIAGQVHTVDGRLLHVAVMTHGWDSSLEQARTAIDRLLVGLAGCGCR